MPNPARPSTVYQVHTVTKATVRIIADDQAFPLTVPRALLPAVKEGDVIEITVAFVPEPAGCEEGF